ncbi:MAG: LuxR C-terminal-related transcriptional regulator [Polyangiaceae bacterium]
MTNRKPATTSADRVALQLLEALGSSLDVRAVLQEAYPFLTRLVPADYGALGVSSTAKSQDFEWVVAELPSSFFAAYPDMAPHDFVRHAVLKQPNRVLRDQEMVSRRELEQNMMYRRAREVGAPVEHVMAVMLHVDDHWQSGLSLYRERHRPFSEVERARLQRVTPALANAVRNCRQFGHVANWKNALDGMLASTSEATLLVTTHGTEVERSPGVTTLLQKWFAARESDRGCLPEPLVKLALSAHDGGGTMFRRHSGQSDLKVSIHPVSGHFGNARWMLRFQEHSNESMVPEAWLARLTPREQQVTPGVLRGWDNRLIGGELQCAEATVKKHLQSIFQKLGLESRTSLVARAMERLRS